MQMSTNRARLKWKPKTKKAAPVIGNRVTVRMMTPDEVKAMQTKPAGSWVDRTGRVK